MADDTSTQKYIPGVCNIGPQELKSRKKSVIIGIILTLITVTMVHYYQPAEKLVHLAVFIPLCVVFISGLQVIFRFCVAFGLLGMFSFNGERHKMTADQKDYLKADQIMAIKLILGGAALSAIITAFYYCLQ